MSDMNDMGCPMSPDFKRLVGRQMVIRKRKRSSAPVDESSTSNGAVSWKPAREQSNRSIRNPFRVSTNLTDSASGDEGATPTDRDVVPSTPEKKTTVDLNVVPSTPDDDGDDPVNHGKRRRVVAEDARYNYFHDDYTTSSYELPSDTGMEDVKDYQRVSSLHPDLSLIRHVKIIGEGDLSRLTNVSQSQSALALYGFTSRSRAELGDDPCVAFHQALHYYQYPDLPWLQLCPRLDDRKQTSSALSEQACSRLHSEWKEALCSAYTALRAGLMPEFYLMCDGFSALFTRCESCVELSAVVSPTTRGFRQNLKDKGIKHSLPLYGADDTDVAEDVTAATVSGSLADVSSGLDADSSMTETSEADDPLDWLEGIGMERSNFPSLRTAKVQQETDSFRKIDYRPASTVLVQQAPMVDKLFSFLSSYNRCAAATGHLANIPACVVSRSPFAHASINKVQVRQGERRDRDGALSNFVDLTGVILPGVVQDILSTALPTFDSQPTRVSITRLADPDVYNTALKCLSCSTDSDRPIVKEIICSNGTIRVK